ncbi:MAG: hypothetical protein ABI670_18605 [Chloroflexota bacterium]
MRASVTITDLTRMQGDRVCVAGYLRDGTCIRPVFHDKPLTESWLWLKASLVIRPFAEVELEILDHTPHPPHSEDYRVNPTYYRFMRLLNPDKRAALLEKIRDNSVASIFGAPIQQNNGWFITAGQGTRSLGTVKAATVDRVTYTQRPDGRWDYRIAFKDGAGISYRLAVTDLAFRCYLDHARLTAGLPPDEAASQLTARFQGGPLYLRIGLARGWEKYPDRCHLQITGVYSFPDYLGGKCFADFDGTGSRSGENISVPF